MPDPYSFNTKRYETFWLNFMVEELALCPATLVVAHGTAADAVLRFVESREVWGAVLVCPGGEMYHAGERHGRAYVWPRVRRGCEWLAMAHGTGDPVVGEAEQMRMKEALGVHDRLFREISGGQERLRDRTGGLLEVEELVLSAFSRAQHEEEVDAEERMTSNQEGLVCELRELAGCENLTVADLGELRWQTKQRIFLGLLAELPEGKDAVMTCAQLQIERNRTRQLDKAAKALPEASRRAEDQLRQAFFSEVGAVLSSLGAALALRAPKKLSGDAGVCLRAIAFLAARVSSRQRRRSSAPTVLAAAASSPGATHGTNGNNHNNNNITGNSNVNTLGSTHIRGATSSNRNRNNRSATNNSGIGNHSVEEELLLAFGAKPSPAPAPARVAGVKTTQTPRLSRRRRRSLPVASSAAATAAATPVQERSAPSPSIEALRRAKTAAGSSGPGTPQMGAGVVGSPSKGERQFQTRKEEMHHRRSGDLAMRVKPDWAAPGIPLQDGSEDGGVCGDRAGASGSPPPPPPLAQPGRSGAGPGPAAKQHTPAGKQLRKTPSLHTTPSEIGGGGCGGGAEAGAWAGESMNSARVLPRSAGRERPRPGSSRELKSGLSRGNSGSGLDGNSPSGFRDAVGMEMSLVGDASSGYRNRSAAEGARWPEKNYLGEETSAAAPDVEAVMAENARLRQRVEELQELVDSQPADAAASTTATSAPTMSRGIGPCRGRRGGSMPTTAGVGPAAAASDAILRGQVAQLRRQVRLQWCAVDASSAVTREVKDLLGHLEDTLLELTSLGRPSSDAPREPSSGAAFRRHAAGNPVEAAAGAAPGGIFGDAALLAWQQVLDRVKALSRQVQGAERAAQKAVDGRLHISRESGAYLKPCGRGQRRPRDLRLRAVDPDHFTRPPPAHGELHHQRPGIAPPEGHTSVITQEAEEAAEAEGVSIFSPPSSSTTLLPSPRGATGATAGGSSGGGRAATPPVGCSRAGARAAGGSVATKAAAAAAAAGAEAAAAAAAEAAVGGRDDGVGVIPDIREMYHLDAASLAGFAEAAAAATRALEALLASVGGGPGRHRNSVDGNEGRKQGKETWSAEGLPPPTGVASLLLGADGVGGDGSSGGACRIVAAIAEVRDTFRGLTVAAASLGVVVPCAPEGAGAASNDSCGPSVRLLRGVKAAGGSDGARRLEALARRLPMERAALEAAAAAGAAEARGWRASVAEQAEAVIALGQGLRGAWSAHVRQASSLSRALAAVLSASSKLLSSPESAPISRGAAGSLAAGLLQTLAVLQPELDGAAAGAANHARKAEEAVSCLWKEFEAACLGCGMSAIGANKTSEASADVPDAAYSGEKARDGVSGDNGEDAGRGGRDRAAPDGRAGVGAGAEGGRGRRRRVGGGIPSKSRGPSSVSGVRSGRDLVEGGPEGVREASMGVENGRQPWVD
eukprot:g11843.t1